MMKCILHPHGPLNFNTYAEYETHYQQNHTNRCRECGKNFPTEHFFGLHTAENHDPILASKRDAGEKTYACFVEDCDKVCSDWKKRRSHLVDKHGFPRNYDFLVVDHGIDHRRSMLRAGIDAQGHRKSSRERQGKSADPTETTEATQSPEASSTKATINNNASGQTEDATENGPQADVTEAKAKGEGKTSALDDLTSSFSSLQMVPRSVTFGQRKGRSGFAKS